MDGKLIMKTQPDFKAPWVLLTPEVRRYRPYTSCLTHKSNAWPVCSNAIFILLVTVEFGRGHITLLEALRQTAIMGIWLMSPLARGFGGPLHIIQHQSGRRWCGKKKEHSSFIPRSRGFNKAATTIALEFLFIFLSKQKFKTKKKKKKKTPEL